ncbi:hypothetical protein TNCV_1659751 [Trichonephila clavipes]|nr:hypothetical protein TNCV_1659751 [Trichonephila clavipes]
MASDAVFKNEMCLKLIRLSPVLPISCTRYTTNHLITGSVFTLAYLLHVRGYRNYAISALVQRSTGLASNALKGISRSLYDPAIQVRARFQLLSHPGSSLVSSLQSSWFEPGFMSSRQDASSSAVEARLQNFDFRLQFGNWNLVRFLHPISRSEGALRCCSWFGG